MKRSFRVVGLAAGLVWLAASLPAHGQGAIRYFPNVNMGMYGIDEPIPWDVDRNGSTDFIFQRIGVSFSAYPQAGSHILALPSPPPDQGSRMVALGIPSELGNYDYSPLAWVGAGEQGGFPMGVGINACSNGLCAGSFVGIRAYFGFNIEIDGQVHYGWATFNAPVDFPGGILEEYAYNLTPGAPIFVGQVPEPSTWVLLTTGVLAFAVAGRRRRLSGHSG